MGILYRCLVPAESGGRSEREKDHLLTWFNLNTEEAERRRRKEGYAFPYQVVKERQKDGKAQRPRKVWQKREQKISVKPALDEFN